PRINPAETKIRRTIQMRPLQRFAMDNREGIDPTVLRRAAMSKRRNPLTVGRRNFLKSATLAGAAGLAPRVSQAQPPVAPLARAVPRPDLVAETMPPVPDPVTQTSGGADFMVDVLKTLDLDYCAIQPASMFRGIHEAIVNHGMNTKPELLTCT